MNRRDKIATDLLKNNIIMLTGQITPELSNDIIQQLLFLDKAKISKKDNIELYINSPGGCIVSGLAIYDTIKTLKKEVVTVGIGMCASMGALLLCGAAKKGNRYILPNCQVMFHEASSNQPYDKVSQNRIRMAQTEHLSTRCVEIIAQHTGQEFEKLKVQLEKDIWLDGQAVLDFGAADIIR